MFYYRFIINLNGKYINGWIANFILILDMLPRYLDVPLNDFFFFFEVGNICSTCSLDFWSNRGKKTTSPWIQIFHTQKQKDMYGSWVD